MELERLKRSFFARDPLEVAEELPGTLILRKIDGELYRLARITEVRAFKGIGRKMNPDGMKRSYGMIYVAPFRRAKLFNITTTLDSPSCVWVYEVETKGSIYRAGKLSKILKIDMNLDGMSIESPEILLLRPQKTYEVVEVEWPNSPSNYCGGYRLKFLFKLI